MMRAIVLAGVLAVATPVGAKVVGSMTPAEPITAERIAALPPGPRAA